MSTNHQNIAILGAGIMGLSAAYTLGKAGHNITLYDPSLHDGGFTTHNASALAGGMLAPYSEIEHMDAPWIDAGLHGIALWRESGLEMGLTRNGSLLIAHPQDRYVLERFKSHLPPALQVLHSPRTIEPALPEAFQTGLFLPDEAYLDPKSAMTALLEAIKDFNADLNPSAQDPAALTSKHDLVIDCRGYGARNEEPELRGVKGEILIVRNEEFALSRPVRLMHPRYPLYIAPRADSVFMIGATMIEGADEHVSVRSGMELMSALYSLHPSFGEAEIISMQAGIRPAYPDNLPRIRMIDNIISANGLFRHGFLLAPVMARCIADHIAGQRNIFMTLFTGEQNDRHDQWSTNHHKSTA